MTNKSKKVLKIKEKIKKYKSMIKLEKFENPKNNDKCNGGPDSELCRINEDIKAQNEALDNYKDGREGIAIALIVCVFFSMIFGGWFFVKLVQNFGELSWKSEIMDSLKYVFMFWRREGQNFADDIKLPMWVFYLGILFFIAWIVLTGILFSNKKGDEWRAKVKALEKDESGQNCIYNKGNRCDLVTFKDKSKGDYHCRGLISDAEVNEKKECHNKDSPPLPIHVKIAEYLLYALPCVYVICGFIGLAHKKPLKFIENKNDMKTSKAYLASYRNKKWVAPTNNTGGKYGNGIVWIDEEGEWKPVLPSVFE
jgi:hypothetical protein